MEISKVEKIINDIIEIRLWNNQRRKVNPNQANRMINKICNKIIQENGD